MVRQELPVARQHQSVLSNGARRVQGSMGRHSAPGISSPEGSPEPSPTESARVNRPKVVWIANEGGHSYHKAEKFGRLMPLTTGNVNYFNLDRLMVSIAPKLKSATADDYLLISGTPVIVALVVLMWVTRFGVVNLLQWSQSRGDYIEIVLTQEAVERMSVNGGLRAS